MSGKRINSRQKGARGERQWRDELRANGYDARRGQQFSGSPDSPDVVSKALSWIHFEVKAVERLNIEEAMEQARRDAGGKVPIVAHRRNRKDWLVTMPAEVFFEFLRGNLPPAFAGSYGAASLPAAGESQRAIARSASDATYQDFEQQGAAQQTNQQNTAVTTYENQRQ